MTTETEKSVFTVDEFLNQPPKESVTGTIEAIDGKPDYVKVTPRSSDGRCHCEHSFELPKSAIASVRLTSDVTECCGKVLRIGEVTFKDGATLSVTDFLRQSGRRQSTPNGGHAQTFVPTSGMNTASPQLAQTLSTCFGLCRDSSCLADCIRRQTPHCLCGGMWPNACRMC